MTKKQKRHIIATIGTLILMALLFLLLWFVYLSAPVPEQEEGIEVAFGEVEDAGGYMSEQSEAIPLPSPRETAPEVPSSPSPNNLLTQEDPSLALQRQKEKEERERKAREEQARLEAERKAKEAAEAERKAKEAEAIAKANQFGSLFSNSGSNTGSGDGQGSGQKHNPVGEGKVGGNSWKLAGREIIGTFPVPQKGQYMPGKVVIEIQVNPQGQVVNARETTGGNISDRATIEAMLKKAREVRFNAIDLKTNQIGYITYIIPD